MTGEWDAADAVTAVPGYHPWRVEDAVRDELEAAARTLWDALPEQNRGWLKISGFIPFRTVVAIDELGDDVRPPALMANLTRRMKNVSRNLRKDFASKKGFEI